MQIKSTIVSAILGHSSAEIGLYIARHESHALIPVDGSLTVKPTRSLDSYAITRSMDDEFGDMLDIGPLDHVACYGGDSHVWRMHDGRYRVQYMPYCDAVDNLVGCDCILILYTISRQAAIAIAKRLSLYGV